MNESIETDFETFRRPMTQLAGIVEWFAERRSKGEDPIKMNDSELKMLRGMIRSGAAAETGPQGYAYAPTGRKGERAPNTGLSAGKVNASLSMNYNDLECADPGRFEATLEKLRKIADAVR